MEVEDKKYRPLSPTLVYFIIGWKRARNTFDPLHEKDSNLKFLPAEVIKKILDKFNELPYPFRLEYFTGWKNISRLTCGDGLNWQYNFYENIKLKSWVDPKEFYLNRIFFPARKVDIEIDKFDLNKKRPIEGEFLPESHVNCDPSFCEYKWEETHEKKKLKSGM